MIRVPAAAALIVALGCAGLGGEDPDAAPKVDPEVILSQTQDEAAARAWGATEFGRPTDEIAVSERDEVGGDVIFGVKPTDYSKQRPGKNVLVRDGVTYAGRKGFQTWLDGADRDDALAVATVCAYLVLDSRSEVDGARYDDQGRLVFRYGHANRGDERKAVVTFGADGRVASIEEDAR